MCLCAIGTAVKASLCTHQMNKWAAPLPVLAYALGIAAKYREDTERPLPSQAGPRNRCVTVWKRLLSKPTDEFTTAYEQASTSAMVLQLIDPSDGRNRRVTKMRHPGSPAHRPTSLRVQHAVQSWILTASCTSLRHAAPSQRCRWCGENMEEDERECPSS